MNLLIHDYGGYAFQVELSRELSRRGHRVTHAYVNFLATARGSYAREPGDPPTLEFCAIPMDPAYEAKKYAFFKRFFMNLQYAWRLLRVVRRLRPDCILSGNTPTEIQLPLFLLSRLLGVRFANWMQDFFSLAVGTLLTQKFGILGRVIGVLYQWADQWVIRSSHVSVVICADFNNVLEDWGIRGRIAVIPNWASIEKIPQVPKLNSFARDQALSDKFTFLYSGTLGLKHDCLLFVALAEAFAADPAVRIVVVAEGAGATWLREEAARKNLPNLFLLPYQPAEQLPSVLGSADVLMAVLGATAGQFSVPSKVLTYLCAGRPVLLSVPRKNLVSRIILEHELGFVAEPGQTNDWLEYAKRLHSSAELRGEMGARARRYAETHFPIGRVADQFETTLACREKSA